MPGENNNNNTGLFTYIKHGFYGLGIRGGTTLLYANLGDTIRTLAQTQNLSSSQVYSNAIKDKGFVAGTWDLHTRGMLPNLVRLGSREFTRAALMSVLEGSMSSGIGKALVMTSIDAIASIPDTVKVLQQSNSEYRNRWLYPFNYYLRGVLPTAYRQSMRWGAVYVVKPIIHNSLENSQDTHHLTRSQIKWLETFLVGMLAGGLVVPFDVVKSRIQNGQGSGNYLVTAWNMLRHEGIRALGRGGVPKALITMNAVLCTSVVQELIKKDLSETRSFDYAFNFRLFSKNESPASVTTSAEKASSPEDISGPGCN